MAKAKQYDPKRTFCPTCGRPCSVDELSGCMTCDAVYCEADSWACACDVPALPSNVIYIR
jgi:hypothetical protein